VETLQLKTRLYSLAVDLILTQVTSSLEMGSGQVKTLLDLNEWEETMILVSLLTAGGPMAGDPHAMWLKHRFSILMRIYPYVASNIFQAAPAWLRDL